MNLLGMAILAALLAAACYGVRKMEDDLWR